jgi:transposase
VIEVLVMETIAKIRRKRLVEHESIRQIARDLNVSRNTVRRVLRGDGAAPLYRRARQPRRQLGPYITTLHRWLEEDATKPKRQRRNCRRLYQDLLLQGYSGAIDSIRRYAAHFQRTHHPATAFIPLSFEPGEAYQFDWSHEQAELGGVVQTIKVAQMRLCHSRLSVVMAYPRETQEMVFDAHARALAVFGGIPRRGIYDNMRTAVDAIFVGRHAQFNRRFLAMCNHYLIEPTACNPAAAWEKGQVERQVGVLRSQLFVPRPKFADFTELNAWLLARCLQDARAHKHPDDPTRTVWEVFGAERPYLAPLVPPFDGYLERSCRVSSTALVSFDGNRYSVPTEVAGSVVAVRAYAERIVLAAHGATLAEHPREFGRHRTRYNPWHYVPALARKPGALRNGAPFKDWNLPTAMTKLRAKLARHPDGDQQFVEILVAVMHEGLEAVAQACADALDVGVAISAYVLNVLARAHTNAMDGVLQVPDQLRLHCEPEANFQRYDRLLKH